MYFAVTATSTSNTAARMFSNPAALPLLTCLMAMLISSIVGGPTLNGRSVGGNSISGWSSGAGRFEGCLGCSTHPFCYTLMLVITLLSLDCTGRFGLR
ncbi:unnamed protein product [Schistosoma curassoni]|uniref:Secreted peptide n=1 Tax=Schistosoma curassoni TaxID=6186 RepID=A0A183KR59_9TREM|nr:unnamed protein product [Schistosoma curassoni]